MEKRGLILVVDDDEDSRVIYPLLLRRAGYEVQVASRGDEALELARTETPDLVLLDRMMPRMTGDDVLASLRAEPRTRDVPVIAFTAANTREEIPALVQRGYTDVVLKPVDPAIVLASVERTLDR